MTTQQMEREETMETTQDEVGNGSRREQAQAYLNDRPHLKRGLVFGFVAVVIFGAFVWWHYSTRESTDNAQIEGHILALAARVGGTVLKVHVSDNQLVDAGTVVAEIDPTDYQVAVQRAQAELADAEAALIAAQTGVPIASTTTSSQLTAARGGVDMAQAGLGAARQQVEAAEARLRQAEAQHGWTLRDMKRLEELVKKDEISKQQYDAAVTAEQAAAATVEAARAAAAAARNQVRQAEGQLQQAQAAATGASTAPQQVQVSRARAGAAQAALDKARAALRQAQLNLGYTQIKAPFAGIVSKKTLEVGQVIQPGQPLMALINLDDLWVVANFKETQLRKMHPGQTVQIGVDAYGREYTGKVQSIGGATGAKFSLLPAENATGNFVKVVQRIPVKITFDPGQDPEHRLRPGMSVEPTVMVK